MDVMMAGKLSALLAAFLWSLSVTIFTFAARRSGAQVANATRLVLASLLLLVLHWLYTGTPWPSGLGSTRVGWLILSGIIGFSIADSLGMEAFLRIGPRNTMLLQTLTPVFSATLAWSFLGQSLSWSKVGAIGLTLAGIALVVGQTQGGQHSNRTSAHWGGLMFALCSALGQALAQFGTLKGMAETMKGMADGVPAFSATVVRITAGAVGILCFMGARGVTWHGLRSPWTTGWSALAMTGGTLLGSVLAVPLSLYALANAPMGIASTLMFMIPVFLLPLSRIFFHDPITPRAIAGTLLTVGGAAALFLVR